MQLLKSFQNISILIALSFTSLTSLLSAQDWKAKCALEKVGSHAALPPLHLTYQASFNSFIKAGEVGFIFGKKDKKYPQYFVSQAYGGSYYKMLTYKFDMSSFSNPRTLLPKTLIVNESDKKERVKITNQYSNSSVKNKKVTKTFKTGKTETKSYTFQGVKVHDPLTAMLFLRSQKLQKGDKTHLCIHPFNSPYYGIATVLGREKHNGQPCIKLDLALRKINKETGSLGEYKKLTKATIWITDDAYRIPLEFSVKIKLANHISIGSARLTLIKSNSVK